MLEKAKEKHVAKSKPSSEADGGTATKPCIEGKELVVAVPLVGTALAVCFDVGFFWGLDISYFTFFSIVEHALFALQAIPVALLISIRADILYCINRGGCGG